MIISYGRQAYAYGDSLASHGIDNPYFTRLPLDTTQRQIRPELDVSDTQSPGLHLCQDTVMALFT